ncbi:MFS transporter [Egicoccus halophilus]|uniref:MFS transporter n=1 Tax=Egicoccus halophilus TaxID=1670830 RepID=UPI0013EECF7B|nr:MFS transporter [Egicoccus halophilus]
MDQRGTSSDQRRTSSSGARDRLGANYRRLWVASTTSNLGDGMDSAALPLLAEALTRDPMLFAGVAIAGRLPWLLFSLYAGVIADRVDRRRLMYGCNAARFALMAAFGAAVVFDVATIWLLYAVSIGLGTFEVLFDNAASALMPAVVRSDQLEKANGRLFAGEIVTNQFVGPALGAWLFGIAAALPILLDAGTFAISAALIFAMTGTYSRDHRRSRKLSAAAEALEPDAGDLAPTEPSAAVPAATPTVPGRRGAVAEIGEGLAWLRRHRLLWTFALLTAAMNGATMMGYAILGLFAVGEESVLQLGQASFGLLFVAGATGSLLGSFGAERIAGVLGRGVALRISLVAIGVVPLAIGLTGDVAVYLVAQALYGFAAVMWNVITISLRQRLVPDELLGRVNSVFRFLGWGAMPVGALVGGATAAAFGLRAPWLTAAGVMTVAVLLALPVLTPAAVAAADDEARSDER